MRLFFASDVHGSERCFTKFVNAAEFYRADVIVLGGDITGKALVPFIRTNGNYRVHFLGDELSVAEGTEADELEKQVGSGGFYPYRCTQDEYEALEGDAERVHAVFLHLILQRLERWLTLADERLRPRGTPCLINAGNDDPPDVDDLLKRTTWVEFLEGRAIELSDGIEMASCGYANKTPWDCPRDIEEDELGKRLNDVIGKLSEPERAIFNFHCPPYNTMIDSGPALGPDMRLQAGAGGLEMRPVGSTACRAAIERYQPLLGLHGHLHESRGSFRLGRTLCINPGSEYTEGILRGALLELKKGKIESHQLTAG
jgi:Icc-related predicted phosphoesterase